MLLGLAPIGIWVQICELMLLVVILRWFICVVRALAERRKQFQIPPADGSQREFD